ncbi:MAG: DMT family transporter [Lachnospiraceae bacterium]|nr:DMT family transporter [Lachnospiraceae bacterium]
MKQRNQGIAYIIASGFFFALMTFFVRLAGDLPSIQKAFFRNAVAGAVAIFLVMKSSEGVKLKKANIPTLLLRSICGTVGLICNFYAVDHMNIADANMLNKLSPFFAIIMSYFILKEKADKVEWIAVIVAFIGALFVVKPSFSMQFVYALIGVLGGMTAGMAYTFVRKLGMMGERGPVIIMFFSVFSCLSVLPFLVTSYEPMGRIQLIYLLAAGSFAAAAQLCITAAYTKAPAKEISVFDYTQVVFAALLGILFLDQIPDLYSILGYIIILGTAIWKWNYNMRKDRARG